MVTVGCSLFILAFAFPRDPSDEVVRLRNGRTVSGSVRFSEPSAEGFVIQPWDSAGTVFIRWSQLPPTEIDRILRASAPPPRPGRDTVEGIRVHTFSRSIEGVLVREEADRLIIKTSESRMPVAVPKNGIVGRSDHLTLQESAAYGPEERVERRVARLGDGDADGVIELAGLASRWGLYAKARDLYLRAAAMAPSRREEVDSLIGVNEALAREGKAAALLAEALKLARTADYARARGLAEKLLSDWPDTTVARQHQDLPSRLDAEAGEWKTRKSEVLARLVPETYRERIAARLSRIAHIARFSEAKAAMMDLDTDIAEEIGRELRSSPDEVRTAWGLRERRVRTVGFASGSWIPLGGQDGGLDTDAKFIPVQRNLAKPPPPPIDLGLRLDTPEDWWTKAGAFERRDWVEAEYARTSTSVEKKLKERRCPKCLGEGKIPACRRGIDCEARCPRCHGAKFDQSVEYQ